MQANVYWQGCIAHANAFKVKADVQEARANEEKARADSLQAALKAKDDELCLSRAELITAKENEGRIVDDYLKSKEFVDLMDVHDKGRYPEVFTAGWEEAFRAVLDVHPSAFSPSDFTCPQAQFLPRRGEFSSDDEDESDEDLTDDRIPSEDRILDPIHPHLPLSGGAGTSGGKDPMDEDLGSSSPTDDARD